MFFTEWHDKASAWVAANPTFAMWSAIGAILVAILVF